MQIHIYNKTKTIVNITLFTFIKKSCVNETRDLAQQRLLHYKTLASKAKDKQG